MTGLRQLKRQQTHQAISEAAIALFLERGFDEVSVAEVAAAARVSKPTLFKYFAAKEDLVMDRISDHRGEAARVASAGGADPVGALCEHFLRGLERRDPVTGLNDTPAVLAYHRLVFETPSLAVRVAHYMEREEAALAEVLEERHDALAAAVLAAQLLATQRVLARRFWLRLSEGASADDLYPEAAAAVRRAFGDLVR
ncbi:TetR family transcriptional regulator [Nonomuraea longicatena]|uniref:TetR family transcriptional regulator n=1 Tax=Nonomuraea longicatena TaxID=83682 RepID=A0ABP4AG73_9ACTN